MKTYFNVYILKCSDNTFYTGVTSNIEKRIAEHQEGKFTNAYTYSRRPVELVYSTLFTDYINAFNFEKKIKKWSQVKKQALINDEFEKLPNLAKKKFNK